MKNFVSFVFLSLIALSLVMSCNKKKDEKAAAPAPEMGAEMAVGEMAPTAPVMKEDPKPELTTTAQPADPSVTAPTLTTIAELGTPMFAVHVELAKLFESAAFKATGLEQKLNEGMMEDKDFPREAIGKCLGIDLTKAVDLVSSMTVFGNSEEDVVVLAQLPMESEKMFGCLNQVSQGKKNKVAEEMFGATKGYKVTAKDGDVTHFVGVGKNLVLIILGEQKDFIAKLKVGEGNLGKGDVAGYFPGGPQIVKVVLRNLPLDKINKEGGKVQIPNLGKGDLDGTLHVTDVVKLAVKLDTKDAKAAEAMIGMGIVMKGLTQVKDAMNVLGLDPNLLDAIKLAANGNIASLSVELDAAKAKSVAEVFKKQLLDKESKPAEAPVKPE